MKNSQKFLPLDGAGLLSSRSDALHRNAYLAALRHIGRGASGSAFPRGAWERVKFSDFPQKAIRVHSCDSWAK